MPTETQVPLTETTVEATVKDGGLRLDDRVDVPNESRVEVTIRPLPPLTRIAPCTIVPDNSVSMMCSPIVPNGPASMCQLPS